MSRIMQMVLCALPYAITLVLLVSWIQPSLESARSMRDELSTLNNEYNRLASKLKEKEALLEQKRILDTQIAKMRASVPPAPEIDILMIDLEKMSDQSGTELIGIEPIKMKPGEASENLMESILSEVGGRLPMAAAQAKKPVTNAKPVQTGTKPDEKPELDPLGIQHVERRVFLTGNYKQLSDFLKHLEAYQRIVGVRGLIVAAPDDPNKDAEKTIASEKARALKLDEPVMTFLMSVYYLP